MIIKTSSYRNSMVGSPRQRNLCLSSMHLPTPSSSQASLVRSKVTLIALGVLNVTSVCVLDAHAHILQYGFKMQLKLDEARTLSDLLDTLEDYVKEHPLGPDAWLEAIGWDQTRWSDTDGSFPTAVHLSSFRARVVDVADVTPSRLTLRLVHCLRLFQLLCIESTFMHCGCRLVHLS